MASEGGFPFSRSIFSPPNLAFSVRVCHTNTLSEALGSSSSIVTKCRRNSDSWRTEIEDHICKNILIKSFQGVISYWFNVY